ncbi:MAG: TonB-dependent receptor [Longimicrobiales bacterium]
MRSPGPALIPMIAVLLLLPVQAAAQTGSLRGAVLTESGSPVAGATVQIVGSGRMTVTDSRGQFLLLNVPAGTHTLRVETLGYSTAEAQVTVSAGEATTHNLRVREAAIALERIAVTVGSRARHTAADELAVPVDVFTRTEIVQATPHLEMAVALEELSPAIYFPRPQIADVTSGVRPFQLRGLSPDHSLVLINGKRRHPTAVIHVFGAASGGSGSSGVDMNAIVPSAIGGMEILRDGAAAQYGSDAIAGVINLQLRNDIHAPEVSATLGQYRPSCFDPDGRRIETSASTGMALGSRGSLVVAGMFSDRQKTERAGADPRDQIVPGDADAVERGKCGVLRVVDKRNDAPQPNHLIGDGLSTNGGGFFNTSYALGAEQVHSLYAFGGYTFRRDIHSGFYRRGIDNRNWPTIHPVGFLPKFRGDTKDYMGVAGVQGLLGAWRYDVSGQWGGNTVDLDIFDSHNVSLGPCLDTPCAPGQDGVLGTADDPGVPNKTDVYAGTLHLNQVIGAVDLVRELELGLSSPLNVALGAALRGDNFEIKGGETASWVNGWHPHRNGGIAAPGSQVFTGYRPDQEVDEWRRNVGLYSDLEAELVRGLRLAGAARFENYSDFGSTLTGKLAMRVQPWEQFIIRAAASTGFRAPNINQSYYAHVSTGFRSDPDNPGNQIAYEIGEIPVSSPEAKALGAQPLKEERSTNLSGGLAFSPTENLTFTVDGYQIDVDDRIILSGSLEGPTVERLLAQYGAPTVKFFMNGVDTRTRGLDLTARYRQPLGGDDYLEAIAQYNRNTLDVTDVRVPPVIAELREQVFDSDERYAMENGRPEDRATLRTRYQNGRGRVSLSANYYGVQAFRLEETPATFLDNGPHTVLDGELSLRVRDGIDLTVGAENLTNERPAVRPEGFDFLGIFPFYSSSGLHMNGRYVFMNVRVQSSLF